MAGPRSILKSFESLKGLDLRSSDITRDPDAASVFKNVRKRRKGSLIKRKGYKAVIGQEDKVKYGIHNYTRSIFTDIDGKINEYPSGAVGVGTNTINWANVSNATASDGSFATATFTAGSQLTNGLQVSNFGLDLPDNAIVTGFIVKVEAKSSASRSVTLRVRLFPPGGSYGALIGNESISLTTTEEIYTFGSKEENAGLFLDAASVNSTGFAVRLEATNGPLSHTFSIDAISIDVYYKLDTGDVIEELIGIGDRIYRLKEGSFNIAYSGGASASFSFTPAEDGTNWTADLKESGSSVGNFPINYGESYLDSSDTLRDLADEIDAVSGFSTTLTPAATVVSYSSNVLTVASGQTFSEGDFFEFEDSQLDCTWLVGVAGDSTTSSISLSPSIGGDNSSFVAASAQEIGIGKLSVGNIPFTLSDSIANGSSVEYVINYWEPIPLLYPTDQLATTELDPKRLYQFLSNIWSNGAQRRNFSFINHNNICYWGTPFYSEPSEGYGATVDGEEPQFSGLWKYDGVAAYWAGLPRPVGISVADAGSGTGPTSGEEYQYIFQWKHIDAQGNITEGPISDPVEFTGTGNDVDIDVGGWSGNVSQSGYWPVGLCAPNGAGTDTNTIDCGNNNWAIGQVIYFFDDKSGKYVTRKVVSKPTKTTCILDGEPVTTSGSTTYYTSNLRLVVWRTKGDGNIFYLVDEYPFYSVVDSRSDTQLGAQLVIPDRDANPWPKIQYLTSHQGLLVGAGNPDDNDTVYFSDSVLGDGATPAASNNFLVPTNIKGGVTALVSDTEDMLGVFKEEAYYNVVGDLDSLNFSLLRVSEGDWGCPCHNAIVKINESTMFPTKVGFKVIQGGRVLTDFDDILADAFLDNYYLQSPGGTISSNDQEKLVIRRAVGINYPEEQIVIFYIPAESGSPGSPAFDGSGNALYPNTNSRAFIYDYRNKLWIEDGFKKAAFNFAGGMTIYKGNLYALGQAYTSTLGGVLLKQNNDGTIYDYFDGVDSTEIDVRPQWVLGGEPSTFKKFLWLKLWILDKGDIANSSYTWTVNTYRDFDSTTKHTIASRSFDVSTSQNYERRIKLKSGKARALQLQFYNDTIYQAPLLTGFELVVSAPFRPEMKDFKGG